MLSTLELLSPDDAWPQKKGWFPYWPDENCETAACAVSFDAFCQIFLAENDFLELMTVKILPCHARSVLWS
jgi:hypothetical protein